MLIFDDKFNFLNVLIVNVCVKIVLKLVCVLCLKLIWFG